MRTRQQIEELLNNVTNETINKRIKESINIEVLLDIRDLLIAIKTNNIQ